MVQKNKKAISLASVITIVLFLAGCFETKTSVAAVNLDSALGKKNIMPIVIIGSGPAGLSAAVYGARAKRETLVIEGPKPGGLLTETTEVENWPGEVSILGPDIIKKMKQHAQHLGVHFITDIVNKVNLHTWPFKIELDRGETIFAMTLIIATGGDPRKLNIPGEKEYWGSGVTSCAVCDAPFFKNEDVVVVGGGDSAVEEAIQLAPFAKNITILVRKSSMRAAATMQDRLEHYPQINVQYNTDVKEILGNGLLVDRIKLYNNKTDTTSEMPIKGVFLAIGHEPGTALFKGQIDLDKSGYIVLKNRSQQTSVPGVFAAGDVEDHVYRQARVAEGSGVKAALDAERFLQDIGFTQEYTQKLRSHMFKTKKETKMSALQLHNFDEFKTVIDKNKLVFIAFYDEDCPTCNITMPHYDAASTQFKNKALFAQVDTVKATDIVEQLFVHKTPTILVFSDGKIVARYSNALDRKEMQLFIEQFI